MCDVPDINDPELWVVKANFKERYGKGKPLEVLKLQAEHEAKRQQQNQ